MMKKTLLFFMMLFVCTTAVKSQQFYINAGKTSSHFNYENSVGEKLSNLMSSSHTSMGFGFRTTFFTEHLLINFGANYNDYGAIGSDDVVNNYFEWDVSYIGALLGFDVNLFRIGQLRFFARISASAEFMVQGTQTLNSQVINIVGKEDFNAPVFFYRGGLGMQYEISDGVSVYMDYAYGMSNSFKKNPEKLNNVSHNVSFGLFVRLSKKSVPAETHNNVQYPDISELKKQLKENTKRVEELEKNAKDVEVLEKEIAAKDGEMNALKEVVLKALYGYEDKGLRVEQRDGKLYLIMDNELLFEKASWEITYEGREAVWAVGEILVNNPDISVLIEGHTDNTPFAGGEMIKDNWDLSTKRATAVVEILKSNQNINPYNLTAAGRGEHAPIASNDTEEGRAKNRRIEFILTPKLDEVSKILKK